MNDIKMIKGFSSAYPLVCDLKILPNIDGTWVTIQDNVGTSMTIKLSDLSDFICLNIFNAMKEEPKTDRVEYGTDGNAYRLTISNGKELEQESKPRKDEVILTKKEYGELVSSEFDNGYTKGYTEALEQNDALDKIRAEIKGLSPEPTIYDIVDRNQKKDAVWETVNDVLQIIDKYRESEE